MAPLESLMSFSLPPMTAGLRPGRRGGIVRREGATAASVSAAPFMPIVLAALSAAIPMPFSLEVLLWSALLPWQD